MKKEFEHKKIEICYICKKEINTDFDDWAALVDYRMQKQTAIGFYHRKCLNDLVKGQGKVIQQRFQNKLMGFVKGIFTGKTKEVPEMEEFIKV